MNRPIQSCHYISSGSKSRRAFTLVEVIVVVALVAVLMLMIGSALLFSTRGTARTHARVLKKQEIMRQFHTMRRQIINLYEAGEGATVLGIKGTTPREDEIYFITSSMSRHQGVGEVAYRIKRDEQGRPRLEYSEFPYARQSVRRFAAVNPLDEWYPAASIIHGLEVEYQSTNQWRDQWDQDELPDKIKITLWYVDDDLDETTDTVEGLRPYTFIVVPGIKSIF